MYPEWLLPVLLVAVLLLTAWLALRPEPGRAEAAERLAHLERELRDEVARSATATRQELALAIGNFQRTLLVQQGDVARSQNEQIDSFRSQLASTQQAAGDTLARFGEQQANALQRLSDAQADRLRALAQSSEQRATDMREAVERRLTALQQGNEQKLEQMRVTVDDKLQATLEQRLGDSFRQVAERLEQVHCGLGEMQVLARDVGSLNRVLSNVKTRGIFGEVQLVGLLEQVFTAEQYAVNVETVPGSGARVEFAVKLPGRREGGAPLWLPIDAKFPRDDYERLLDAQERADGVAAEAAGRALERRLRDEAKSIRAKYLAPPHTTDFAILFVPTEGLYAEALRRPGLMEALQREHRVTLAGPTTLLASLTSLQMGFRTLALERRSAEVWDVLGAVKTEFGKFGAVLDKVRRKLAEAGSSLDDADRRTRVMTRSLASVEALDDDRTRALLPDRSPAGDGGAEPSSPPRPGPASSETADLLGWLADER